MRKPTITLTTDFGNRDYFVGAMKGVICSICPEANIFDITHEVTPFDIADGAFIIAQAYRWYPAGTIHVVVVDPGVGTSRRPILIQADGHYFIGPDNGVFSMVYDRDPKAKVREITAEKYFVHPVSNTFHGRDIFAPVAAHLAKGGRPARFGKLITDYLRQSHKPLQTGKRFWSGRVLHVDRFGNLITNFHKDEFPQLLERPFVISIGTEQVSTLASNFAEQPFGQLFAIFGSTGFLEIAMNQDSAAKRLGCAAGSPVELAIY